MEAIFAVMNTTQTAEEISHEKNSGLWGIWTYDLFLQFWKKVQYLRKLWGMS